MYNFSVSLWNSLRKGGPQVGGGVRKSERFGRDRTCLRLDPLVSFACVPTFVSLPRSKACH